MSRGNGRRPQRPRIRALRTRTNLERVLRAFRRRYGRALAHVPSTGEGTVLLASRTYSAFQLKLEGMLGRRPSFQGVEPVAADSALPRR